MLQQVAIYQRLLYVVGASTFCRHWAISAVHCLRGGGVRGRLFVLGEFLKVTHSPELLLQWGLSKSRLWGPPTLQCIEQEILLDYSSGGRQHAGTDQKSDENCAAPRLCSTDLPVGLPSFFRQFISLHRWDLSLLQLEQPFIFSPTMLPVCLPPPDSLSFEVHLSDCGCNILKQGSCFF